MEYYNVSSQMDHDGLFEMDVVCLGSRNATIVDIWCQLDEMFSSSHDRIHVSADAIRSLEDDEAQEIGMLFAWGRAFERLGLKFQKRAEGLVKQVEDEKAAKEVLKEFDLEAQRPKKLAFKSKTK